MTALSHIRVLDLTHRISGPFCTKLMAGFGAEVIKIEKPGGGDALRSVGPFANKEEGIERSLPFLWFNTGKKSVALDLKSAAGRELCRQLVAKVDVLVENFAPGTLDSLGLGFDELRKTNPKLVVTSLSNFGQTGPYRDYEAEEITEYAMSGLMSNTGDPAKSPLNAGPAIAQLSAGMKAYIATLMACYRRGETGEGDRVDLSIQEAAMDNFEIAVAENLHLGKVAKRHNDEHALVPWRIYPCKDGHAAIIGGPMRHWVKGAAIFEEPDLVNEKLDHMAKRIENRELVREKMEPWLMSTSKRDIYHKGQANGLAFSYLATLSDAVECPQNKARSFFQETEHPVVGSQSMLGAPFRPEATPWQQKCAPLLGEHTDAVLKDLLELSGERIEELRTQEVIG